MSFRLIPLSVLFLSLLVGDGEPTRKKEVKNLGSVLNLNRMAQCALNHTALIYNNYGCWCGYGGNYKPIDGIDACCRRHHLCYDIALASGACRNLVIEYLDPYAWSCEDHVPRCRDDSSQSKCQQALCWCDKMVVECWKQFPIPAHKLRCNHTPKSP
ncbi:hypothetical protein QR680_013444 [Steinernema hermaphroditum]|uniref:Phospholipase A2 n=1 Tax=Steinernema hermaphroditum TaxID=289476 RepID=A0AA39I731_9BILA|nr:hypothetical protein QR680_013444 [Steinernema hermaphroditum]